MDPRLRVVTSGPLKELWTSEGPVGAVRERFVRVEDIRALLREGPLRLVVAEGGRPLRWTELGEAFDFWKAEVRDHVWREEDPYYERYPGEYCYLSTLWILATGERVVLLERRD